MIQQPEAGEALLAGDTSMIRSCAPLQHYQAVKVVLHLSH
jgi:hypothetical protein